MFGPPAAFCQHGTHSLLYESALLSLTAERSPVNERWALFLVWVFLGYELVL